VIERAESSARWRWITIAFLLGAVLTHIAFIYEPESFLIGDCPYYAQTAISLILDHNPTDVRPHRGTSARRWLPPLPRTYGAAAP